MLKTLPNTTKNCSTDISLVDANCLGNHGLTPAVLSENPNSSNLFWRELAPSLDSGSRPVSSIPSALHCGVKVLLAVSKVFEVAGSVVVSNGIAMVDGLTGRARANEFNGDKPVYGKSSGVSTWEPESTVKVPVGAPSWSNNAGELPGFWPELAVAETTDPSEVANIVASLESGNWFPNFRSRIGLRHDGLHQRLFCLESPGR